jgi:alpha-2-macroglobulin
MRRLAPALLSALLPLALLTLRGASTLPVFADPAALARLDAADRHFQQKSYSEALEAYRTVLKSGTELGDRRPEAEYRYAVSLGKAERWDEALAEAEAFARRRPGSAWEARGQYWLGRLLIAVPHTGYQVGDRIYRGDNVPKTEASEKAQQVWLHAEDLKRAITAFEAAKAVFQSVRRQTPVDGGAAHGPQAKTTAAEEVDLNFDLARLLQGEPLGTWSQAKKWLPPADPSWALDPRSDYRSDWPAPKRVLFLLKQVELLGTDHDTALARLAEGLFLDRYRAIMQNAAQKWEGGKLRRIPYPYQDRDAEPVLRSVLADFPRDPIADQVQYTIGLRRARKGNFVGALEVFRSLVRTRPGSKWVSDAQVQIATILRRQIGVDTGGPQPSGRLARVTLSARNVRQVTLRAYRLRLEEILKQDSDWRDPNRSFSQVVPRYFEQHGEGSLGAPAARWQVRTRDRGDHRPVGETIITPLQRPGAYLIVADTAAYPVRAGNSPATTRVAARGLLLITDRVLVQKGDRDHALFFVADARTGAPEPQARLLTREVYHVPGSSNRARMGEGRTNSDGLFEWDLSRNAEGQSQSVEAVAWAGDQYAASPQLWSGYHGPRVGYKLYSYTDRPVYRPGQTVRFRQLVTRQEGGKITPMVGHQVKVSVMDARGNPVHQATLTTDSFGAVAGEFALGQEPSLGEYSLNAEVLNAAQEALQAGGNRFRVEEYKKPEYEVTVAPDKSSLRVGEQGKAKVTARYYFGAPVPGARVVYHIYLSHAYPRYRFPRPFDFLYRFWDEGDYDYTAYRGDMVHSGETRTDAAGEAEITFDTSVSDPRWQHASMRYTVEAEVTDASRRTIIGSGAVIATRQQFFAFLDTPQGFYQKGDRVPVEVVTLDANEQPVAASGSLKVYRQQWKGDRVDETLVHEERLATDKTGRVKSHWTAERTGSFRLAFEALDAWEVKVVGSVVTWVVGQGAPYQFLRQGVRLVMESDTIPEGGRARLLLITDQPGATVLLTQEANDEILRREVVRLAENSQVLELPLNGGHAPNFYLQATMVRGGQVHQATQEVRVPPVKRLVDVKVTADQAKYKPGERATFRLVATDWRGQPVRGAFSVGIVDASLYAIQKEYAPDVRQYFYADRRSQSVQNTASVGMRWQIDQVDTQPVPKHQLHEWVLPEGMGQLEEWPGRTQLGYYGYGSWEFEGNTLALGDHFGRRNGVFAGGGFAGALDESTRGPAGYTVPSAPLATLERAEARSKSGRADAKEEAQTPGMAPSAVRSNFADTAYWTPSVVTDSQGSATVSFAWPDNLTTWRATTRGWTSDAQVGTATAEVVTRKDLLVRLQAPRFFVERDIVLLSANVHNYLPRQKRVRLRLQLEGDGLELVQQSALTAASPHGHERLIKAQIEKPAPVPSETWLEVPKDGEVRFDWAALVRKEGTVKVRMIAESDEESDAVELSFPVIVHGVEKLTVTNGALLDGSRPSSGSNGGGQGTSTARFTIDVPKARKPGSSELNLQLTPSVAGSMLDALPYLADYPYGCIEQTMSRFLPSVVVSKTLQDLGLRLEDLEKRANAYSAERKAGAGSQRVANSPYTYPKGMPGSVNVAEQASTLWYHRLDRTPVFHSAMLREMVTSGLQRIVGAQNDDGGWGWWPGNQSDPYMSAYVLYGLLTTRDAGWSVPDGVVARGTEFVRRYFLEADDLHRMAYAGSVLAMDPGSRDAIRPLLAGRLYERRERLSPYTKALLAMALHRVGEGEKARVVLTNLGTTAKVDAENQTAHWEGRGDWWRWYENKVETSAVVLQATLLIDPAQRAEGRPLAPQIVKWLVNNRRGQHWHSTKETAMAVYALADYVRVKRELSPEYTLTVDFDGRQKGTYQVNAANVLFYDNRFLVPDALIRDGVQTITITKNGPGNLYYSAFLRTFSLEEDIQGTGNEIFVRRRYFRLLPEDAAKISADRARGLAPRYAEPVADIYRRVPLKSGEELQSGDLLEVELFLESKNDYDYLAFEDLKPAGCEPVELRSGGRGENGLWSHMELRDQKVAFFLSQLPQGTRTLTYRLRAEIPGRFHVLPTHGYAMYAPDIRTLSDEFQLGIRDREEKVAAQSVQSRASR